MDAGIPACSLMAAVSPVCQVFCQVQELEFVLPNLFLITSNKTAFVSP